jgi:hypothetical protein
MAEEYREALLKKDDYYENCPGCKVDQLKELKKGFPFRDLISIWIVVLCTGKTLISNHFGLEKKPEFWLAACQGEKVVTRLSLNGVWFEAELGGISTSSHLNWPSVSVFGFSHHLHTVYLCSFFDIW